jgi:hypothetical protein
MLIQTCQGKCRIDDALVLCIDQHRTEGERTYVTVYLFTGEQITGMLEQSGPVDDIVESRLAARRRDPLIVGRIAYQTYFPTIILNDRLILTAQNLCMSRSRWETWSLPPQPKRPTSPVSGIVLDLHRSGRP